MSDWIARLLAREWLAIALAALLALAAIATGALWLLAPAALLAIGGTMHLATLARVRRAHPPRGRMIDIRGTRIHVLAEGEAREHWPLVMFGGGHSAGAAMAHLHRALQAETRSILIDRPGTGWSGTGAFPRTTAREADEMIAALEAIGEAGPFVIAGYSFGGLLAANIARRRPDLVARLVLLDATPLETLVFGPRLGAIGEMRRDAMNTALMRLLGINIDFAARRARHHPAVTGAFERELGDALIEMRAVEQSAGAALAGWSIYRELQGPHIASVGWETSVYDRDLGDMDVWLVAPGTAEEVTAEPEVAAAQGGGEGARMLRFYAASRERYMATSTASRRIHAPPGSTHQFVYDHPDFVIGVLRDAVRRQSGSV